MRDYSVIFNSNLNKDSTTAYDSSLSFDSAGDGFNMLFSIIGNGFVWYEPKTDWLSSEYMSAEDMNYIESNIQKVAEYLNSIQYAMPLMTYVTTRDMTGIDTLSSVNRLEGNMDAIRSNFLTPAGYLAKKTWGLGDGFTFDDANRWEQNLALFMHYGVMAYENFRYCGTQTCGNEWGLIY